MATRGAIASRTRGSATRERILLEASRLFARRGYHSTSTRDIARVVGIQQPSLFHHFRSKQAIMEELLSLNLHGAVEFSTAMASRPGSPAARLYRVLRADLRHVASVPYDLSGTQGEDVLGAPEFLEWSSKLQQVHSAWRMMVEQGINSRQFVRYDSGLVELTIEGVFKELIRAAAKHSTEDGVPSPDDLARFMLRALLLDPSAIDQVAEEADHLEGVPDFDG